MASKHGYFCSAAGCNRPAFYESLELDSYSQIVRFLHCYWHKPDWGIRIMPIDVRKGADLRQLSSDELAKLALRQAISRGFDHNPIVDEDIRQAFIEACKDEDKEDEDDFEPKEESPLPK